MDRYSSKGRCWLLWLGFFLVPISCTKSSSAPEDASVQDSGPIISQRSTGTFVPYSERDRIFATGSFANGSDTTVALWKTRATIFDRTVEQSAALSLELVQGGGIAETGDLEIVAPVVRLNLRNAQGERIDRQVLRRDLMIESIVDRYVDRSNIAALLIFQFGTAQEERWLIEPQYITLTVADDQSRTVTFPLRETDVVFTLAAVRPKKLPSGWKIFIPPPLDNSQFSISLAEVTDSPSQLGLTWTPSEGSRIGYRLGIGYSPFTAPSCLGGRDLDRDEITSIRQDFPPLKTDGILLSNLLEGQRVYVQLCSLNSRVPPDVSEGLVTWFDLPPRAKALLKGAPSSDTNLTALQIQVGGENISAYRYHLITGATDCSAATYSPWIAIDTPISANLLEGPYALCVLGKISDTNMQMEPTVLPLRVDHTPPLAFGIPNQNQILTSRKPEISWGQVSGAQTYVITVAQDPQCSLSIASMETSSPKLANLSIPDGSYYLCVTAKDAAGNSKLASNNGIPFNVDATPPSSFTITTPLPSSSVFVHTPLIEWTASQGTQSYQYAVGSSPSCSNPVASGQNITSLSTTLAYLNAGTYHLCVTAIDGAGNISAALNSGMSFQISTGTWRPLPSPGGLLSPRQDATGIWAPSYGQMIIWGGKQGSTTLGDGARFDLQSSTWQPITLQGAPAPRSEATAIWDPTRMRMVIWGGESAFSTLLGDGACYEPGGAWTPIESTGAPWPRKRHAVSFTGTNMIVWGGRTCGANPTCQQTFLTNSGGILNIPTNTWQYNGTDTSDPDTPAAREFHTVVWTGSSLIVRGGNDGGSELNTGGRLTLNSQDPWQPVALTQAPSPRKNHTAVWTGSQMLVWGGYGCLDAPQCQQSGYLDNGSLYNPLTNTWTALPNMGSLSGRSKFVSVWDNSAQRLFVWGGSNGSNDFDDGGLLSASQGWIVPQVNPSGSLSPRASSIGVWTGLDVIIYGGSDGNPLTSGAIYTPP